MATASTHLMRGEELRLAMQFFPPGCRVLEVGAGDGWQAARMLQAGFAVTAIDVELPSGRTQHHPVALFDGRSLPFADASFDVVFSSNVLEHVIDFPRLQAEMARVLIPGGISTSWSPAPRAMTITISSRQIKQDASKAKSAAKDGPVLIKDRGRPAHVLLMIEAGHAPMCWPGRPAWRQPACSYLPSRCWNWRPASCSWSDATPPKVPPCAPGSPPRC